MTADELRFFDGMPQMLPIYEKLMGILESRYSELSVKVTKTQISLRNRYVFAMVSLPWRKRKGWPEDVDEELLDWLDEAYQFSMVKGRGR